MKARHLSSMYLELAYPQAAAAATAFAKPALSLVLYLAWPELSFRENSCKAFEDIILSH